MARKRQRFQRSDVPRRGPLRVIGGLIALVAIAVLLVGGVSYLWVQANIGSNLEDSTLESGITSQAEVTPPDGYVASSDEIVNYLIFCVADPGVGSSSLLSAQILTVNKTQGTASLAELPSAMKVVPSETAYALSSLYSGYGADITIAAVSSSLHIRFDHALIAKTSIWKQVDELDGSDMMALMQHPKGLINSVVSDMDEDELLEFVAAVNDVGVSKINRVEVASTEEETDSGTLVNVQAAELDSALGIYHVPDGTEGEATEGEATDAEAETTGSEG